MHTLGAIEERVDQLAAQIGAPAGVLPTYGRSEDMARPHIEVSGSAMAWVVVERGKEWERKTTLQLDELLFWIFDHVTHEMASRFAARHQKEGQDFRHPLFTKQLELMGTLEPRWRTRLAGELGPLLRQAGLCSTNTES